MPQTVYYPDGSSLTTTELTEKQVQIIMQAMTCVALGIVVEPFTIELATKAGQFSAVPSSFARLYEGEIVSGTGIPEGTYLSGIDGLQGTILLTEPATATGTITATISDPNAYAKVRVDFQTEGQPASSITDDVCYLNAKPSPDGYTMIGEDVPGPASGTNATLIGSWTNCWRVSWEFVGPNALQRAQLVRAALFLPWTESFLNPSNLYTVVDIEQPTRVPQNNNAQWWETAYLNCSFYEAVTKTLTTPGGTSVEVIVSDASGKLADTTVSA